MVCDNMSLGDHALYEVRAGLQVVPDNEKRGGNLMLFQGIQDRGSVGPVLLWVRPRLY